MKVLYIIRRECDQLTQEIMDHNRTAGEVSVLLIQDGVLAKLKGDGDILASVNDVEARGIRVPHKLVDYPAICQLIVEHDKVIVW